MILTCFWLKYLYFFASTERNDQTEQEERREIKQRLNRKVCGGSDLSNLLWFYQFDPTFGPERSHQGERQTVNRTLLAKLLLFWPLVSITNLFNCINKLMKAVTDSCVYFPVEPAADGGRAAGQKDPDSFQWLCGSGQSSGLWQASWQALDQTVSFWQGS